MPTTVVCIRKGQNREEFVDHLQNHALLWKAVEGLPRHFIIEGLHHSAFPVHPSVEAVSDGDLEIRSNSQTLTLTEKLDQASWALARIIRRTPPWNVDNIQSPFESYFRSARDGTGVDYYSIDSGMRTTHDEFGGRATIVYEFYSSGGVGDDFGHGTATASCGCGETVGLARGALLWSFKASNSSGVFTTTSIVTTIGQVISHYNGRSSTGRPAVVNMSFTWPDTAVSSAVGDMIDAGIVCVSSANNFMTDLGVHPTYPANTPDVLCVGGIGMNDCSYYETILGTNFGSPVAILGPALNVYLAYNTTNSTYRTWSGTSFASPYTAGVIACMLQGYRRLTSRSQVQAVRAKVLSNATTGAFRPAFGLSNLPDAVLYLDPNVQFETIDTLVPSETQTIIDSLPFYDTEVHVPTTQVGLNDTLSLIENLSYNLTSSTSFSDILNFTEVFNQIWIESLSESVTFTDTSSTTIWKIGNLSEAVTFTEELLNQFVSQRTISDPLEFAEVWTKLFVRLKDFSDSVDFADQLTGIAVKVLGESCTFTDVMSAVVAKVFKDILEFGDILSLNTVLKRSATDQLVLFDSLTYTAVIRNSLSDLLTFNESILGFGVHPIDDSMNLVDSIIGQESKPLSDSLVFNESTNINKVQNRSVSDTLTLNDSLTATKVILQQINDTVSFLENVLGIRQRFGIMSDSLDLTDEQLREVHLGPISDLLTFTESMTFNKNSTRTLSETLEITDDLVVQTTLVRDWTDHLLFSEGFLTKITYLTRPTTPINIIQQTTVPPLSPPTDTVSPSPVWEGVISVLPQVVLIGKTRTIVLPPPEFNDFKAGQGKIAVQRSMTGKFRVYAKRATREKLNWRFVIPKYKADEFRDFILEEIDNNLNVIDWEGNYWNLKILSDSVDFVESRRWAPCGNAVEITVELVGNRYA